VNGDLLRYNGTKWVKVTPNYLTSESDPAVAGNFDFSGAATGDLLQFNGTKWVKVTPNFLTTESDPVFSAWDKSAGISITESQISDLQNYLTTENDPSVPAGTQAGDMQYWNGTAWVTIAATTNEGATLQMIGGVPTWTGGTPPPSNVTNPITGRIWMDRNLGATQVATSLGDAAAYGDLYQWGRAADGHQIRTSGITATLATCDDPGHCNFIISINSSTIDWRNPQNNNLWQGISGTNNPCPSGYRVPTEAEWNAERNSWSSSNSYGAFASPLKLPEALYRIASNGNVGQSGDVGYYWSSSVDGTNSRNLYIDGSDANFYSSPRAYGYSVRCIKD
jgi:uncharacterized protein (TIGR02145 family)